MKYFGFALADGMFAGGGDYTTIQRVVRSAEYVADDAAAGILIPCLNPSHGATIAAMRGRYGIDVEIPTTPPKIALRVGDSIIVMGVRGLPRLVDRHEYTREEIDSAEFEFAEYRVVS